MKLTDWLKSLAGINTQIRPSEKTSNQASDSRISDSKLPVDDDGNESAERGGLNFRAAIKAHQAWKRRLLDHVDGTSSERLNYKLIARDDQCDLGKWIHGQGKKAFPDEPLLEVVLNTHAHFHQLAGRIVLAVDEGRPDEARQLLASDYQRTSVRVQGKLAELFLSKSEPI